MSEPKYKVGDVLKFPATSREFIIKAVSERRHRGQWEYWAYVEGSGMETCYESDLRAAEKVEPFFEVGKKYKYELGVWAYECVHLVDIKGEKCAVMTTEDEDTFVFKLGDYKNMSEVQ